MASQQHIQWLLEGAERWNARRNHDPFTLVAFSGIRYYVPALALQIHEHEVLRFFDPVKRAPVVTRYQQAR